MEESPVQVLERWEHHGARWRVAAIGPGRAVVDLLTCTGEPVDRIESGDPDLLAWLSERGPAVT
jgi:hypothetical protein